MKKVFSLTYVECTKSGLNNVLDAVCGPYLSCHKATAESRLVSYIRHRAIDAFPDMVFELAETLDIAVDADIDTNSSEEAEALLAEHAHLFTFEVLASWFTELANDDGMYFGYEIKELPTTSLIEQLENADVVMVDGQIFTQFSISTSNTCVDEQILIEGEFITPDHARKGFEFTREEVEDAVYSEARQSWVINNQRVEIKQFV